MEGQRSYEGDREEVMQRNMAVLQSLFLQNDTSSAMTLLPDGRVTFSGMAEVFLMPQLGTISAAEQSLQLSQNESERSEFDFYISPNGQIQINIHSKYTSQAAEILLLRTVQEMNHQKTLAPLLPRKFDRNLQDLRLLGEDIKTLCVWIHTMIQDALRRLHKDLPNFE